MSPLPLVSSAKCIKARKRDGFTFHRKGTGSHAAMKKTLKSGRTLVVIVVKGK